MKTGVKKSSGTVSKPANQAFFAKAGSSGFFAAANEPKAPAVQLKMTANKPGDKFENEADNMADKVMKMPAPEERVQKAELPEEKVQKQEEPLQKAELPEEKVQKQEEEPLQKAEEPERTIQKQEDEILQKTEAPEDKLQKQEEEPLQRAEAPEEDLQKAESSDEEIRKKEEEQLQRKGDGAPAVSSQVQSAIHNKTTGGEALSGDVRGFMEPRFGADFSNIRIHHDAEAGGLSNRLSAKAFTYRNHIFFSHDQYRPGTGEGKQLLAHELTHTIQQGAAVQRSPQVTTTTTPPAVQRLGVRDALDYFADKAYHIPGFRMLTILLGFNPINMRSTDRSAANILRALIEFIPGGHLITQALDNHGVFTKVASWVEQKIAELGDIGASIVSGLKQFLDSLRWRDILNLGGVWNRAKRIFTDPIGRLISFAKGLVVDILKMVKDAILKPLAALAQGTAGYDLLCAVLGQDPITDEPMPRNADTLIGGFMKLIGQQEIWENLKKGNAVARAWTWFQGALAGLMGMVRAIPGKIVNTLKSLTFADIITVAGAFSKIVSAFLNIAGEFMIWAFNQVIGLLEILFSVVAPGIMPYLQKAKGAFQSILRNPIGFVGNLVNAGKMGFRLFAGNIVKHLKTALIKWIVGPLADAGVYIPKSFSLIEIVKLVLSVLGLTWQAIRAKLVKIIPDPILAGLEKTSEILVTLVKEGPAAAWEQIKTELSELKDLLIAQVTQMVSTEIVKAAITKLVSMLNPAGAVIQAIIAIYNTITFFVQKLRQIGAVVGAFINSIAAIAAGQIAAVAKRVEQTMANTLTLVLAFLAKFAGLGNIPEKIVGIINKIRKPIDKGLDKIVAWLGKMLKKAGSALLQAGVPKDPNERLKLAANAAVAAARKLTGRITKPLLTAAMNFIKVRYGLQQIEPYERDGQWWVKMTINPVTNQNLGVPSGAKVPTGGVSEPVTVGSWIKNLKTGLFERVSAARSVVKRGADGQLEAVSFSTTKTDGTAGLLSYSKEGVDWERSSFSHPSNFVILEGSGATFVLKPGVRGSNNIRSTFYSDSSSSRSSIKNSKLPALKHPNDSTKFLSEGSAADESAEGYTQKLNGKAIVPLAHASPDHDPPIAVHWTNKQGNDTTQSSRENWNSSLTTYKLMSKKLNNRLGSRGVNYTEKVGVNFRGPGE